MTGTNEMQQLFKITTDEKEYTGIMRLYRHFEGHYLMEAVVDLTDESNASRRLLDYRNDRLPRLEAGDLKPYQEELIGDIKNELPQNERDKASMHGLDAVRYGVQKMVEWDDIHAFNEVLIERERLAEEAAKRAAVKK